MKNFIALIPFLIVGLLWSCNGDKDDLGSLKDRVSDLEEQLDSTNILNYRDSLEFVLALSEIDYKKYVDSLRRMDSIAVISGEYGSLPFAYNVLVYDGSTTSVYSNDDRTAAFDAEVSVSVSQYGETRTITTTDGLASFDNIGHGIVNVTVTASDYTSLQYSFESTVDPTEDLYDIEDDYWDFVKTGNIAHDVAIFALTGESASILTGRVFVESDLTNSSQETVPEGTVITAAIDVEDFDFQEEFILYKNKQIWVDNILSFGYSPNFTTATDADGDYTFTLAGAANENGLPYHFEYSDFLFDQVAFVESTGEVTTEAERTAFGPEVPYTIVPPVFNAANVSFTAGGGATASLETQGNGSLVDIDLETAGSGFQGTPRVFISAPPAGGTQATASATIDGNGRVNSITLDQAGSGYLADPAITITEGLGGAAVVTSLETDGANGGVAEINLTNGGAGYSVPPNVLFSSNATLDSATIAQYAQANSDLPTATATLNANGSISNLNLTNTGSDLSATPTIIITPGFGATATISSVDGTGAITGIDVTTSGEHYTEVVTVSGGSGTGATFTFGFTAGELTSITQSNGGTGYIGGEVLSFNSTFTTRGTAASVFEGLSVETVQINNIGTQLPDGLYYTNPPLIEIAEPDYRGPGSSRAEATAVLGADGRLSGITITDIGSGYYGVPAISVVSGSGATADPELEPLTITEVDVTGGGGGYLTAPEVAIFDVDGLGSGATATANLTNGVVTSITLDNAGTNYSNPQVAILDPGTSFKPTNFGTANPVVYSNPATAEVMVVDGVITEITMLSIGDNYQAAPNVILTAGRGTGFAATATIANGQVTGVTIDSGGEDYIGGNTPGTTEGFFGINDANYEAKTGITRIIDFTYGTGKRDGEPLDL